MRTPVRRRPPRRPFRPAPHPAVRRPAPSVAACSVTHRGPVRTAVVLVRAAVVLVRAAVVLVRAAAVLVRAAAVLVRAAAVLVLTAAVASCSTGHRDHSTHSQHSEHSEHSQHSQHSEHSTHPPGPTAGKGSAVARAGVRPTAADAAFDYQLGGSYRPPAGVRAVSRDRSARPAAGLYSVCYVNAFQAQPGAEVAAWWRAHHPGLLLRADHDPHGALVVDQDWDEPLLDISTPARRAELLGVVGGWIDGCARTGFDAVEPDNLDSYQRSKGLLSSADAVAFAGLLAARGHRDGLAVAQKNTGELLDRRRAIGFDFAVVEECARYDECGEFASAYDRRIFDVEYDARSFTSGCRRWGRTLSITLRDQDVLPAGAPGHRDRRC